MAQPTHEINHDLEEHVLTDKEDTKVLPCRNPDCRRPCRVTRFYAPAKVVCLECQPRNLGESPNGNAPARKQAITHPSTAVHLPDVLINKTFAQATCPLDAEHTMELKSVTHSPHYGPRRFLGHDKKGLPAYDVSPGETVMHQCKECATVVSYSTMHPMQYQRINERKVAGDTNDPGYVALLGVRDEPDTLGADEVGGKYKADEPMDLPDVDTDARDHAETEPGEEALEDISYKYD